MPISKTAKAYRATITRDQAYLALSLAVSVAPNGRVQQAIARFFNNRMAEGHTDFQLVQFLVDVVYDGINSGNWPA